jgi:flagellar protein FliO/FliZ
MGFDTYLRFIMVLVLVIGMIGFIAWMVRRFGLLNRITPGANVRSANRRLSVVESCTVDAKRRLVLIRRDDAEHLLLLTASGSGVVIERGESKAQSGRKKKAPGRKTEKFSEALAREDEEMIEEAAAEEDETVTRFARFPGFGKSAWR